MHQRMSRKHRLFRVIGNSLRGSRDFVNGDYYHMSVIVSGNKYSDNLLSLLYIRQPRVIRLAINLLKSTENLSTVQNSFVLFERGSFYWRKPGFSIRRNSKTMLRYKSPKSCWDRYHFLLFKGIKNPSSNTNLNFLKETPWYLIYHLSLFLFWLWRESVGN